MTRRSSQVRGTLAAASMAALLAAMASTPSWAAAEPGAANGVAPDAAASPAVVTPPPAAVTPPPAAVSAPPPGAPAGVPDEDIRDIRGPKFVMNAWLIPALVAGVALLAVAGYGIWRWRGRRRRPRVLLPFELALQRLAAIRTLMHPPTAREFSIAASDIVRGYIEERFAVTATHRTTEEFLHDLLTSSTTSLARHRGLLEEFLNQCDLVKFAGISLSLETMESLHRSACDFVKETAAPDPEPGTVPAVVQASATAQAPAQPTAAPAARP